MLTLRCKTCNVEVETYHEWMAHLFLEGHQLKTQKCFRDWPDKLNHRSIVITEMESMDNLNDVVRYFSKFVLVTDLYFEVTARLCILQIETTECVTHLLSLKHQIMDHELKCSRKSDYTTEEWDVLLTHPKSGIVGQQNLEVEVDEDEPVVTDDFRLPLALNKFVSSLCTVKHGDKEEIRSEGQLTKTSHIIEPVKVKEEVTEVQIIEIIKENKSKVVPDEAFEKLHHKTKEAGINKVLSISSNGEVQEKDIEVIEDKQSQIVQRNTEELEKNKKLAHKTREPRLNKVTPISLNVEVLEKEIEIIEEEKPQVVQHDTEVLEKNKKLTHETKERSLNKFTPISSNVVALDKEIEVIEEETSQDFQEKEIEVIDIEDDETEESCNDSQPAVFKQNYFLYYPPKTTMMWPEPSNSNEKCNGTSAIQESLECDQDYCISESCNTSPNDREKLAKSNNGSPQVDTNNSKIISPEKLSHNSAPAKKSRIRAGRKSKQRRQAAKSKADAPPQKKSKPNVPTTETSRNNPCVPPQLSLSSPSVQTPPLIDFSKLLSKKSLFSSEADAPVPRFSPPSRVPLESSVAKSNCDTSFIDKFKKGPRRSSPAPSTPGTSFNGHRQKPVGSLYTRQRQAKNCLRTEPIRAPNPVVTNGSSTSQPPHRGPNGSLKRNIEGTSTDASYITEDDHLNAIKNRHAYMKSRSHYPITAQLDYFLLEHEILQTDLQIKYQIIHNLTNILRAKFPKCILYSYGAFATGLGDRYAQFCIYVDALGKTGSSESGASATVAVAPEPTMISIFTTCSKLIKAATVNLISSTKFCKNMKIQTKLSIQFIHQPSGIECELSLQYIYVKQCKLIRFIMHLDPRVRPLLLVILYWGQFHGLTKGGGHRENYVMTLLVLVFLTRRMIIPTVALLQSMSTQKELLGVWDVSFCDNIEQVWALRLGQPLFEKCPTTNQPSARCVLYLAQEFFELYANINFENLMICTYLGEFLPKKVFAPGDEDKLPRTLSAYKKWAESRPTDKRLKVNNPLCVQDPFMLGSNAAHLVLASGVQKFQFACSETVGHLNRIFNSFSPRFVDMFVTMPTETSRINGVAGKLNEKNDQGGHLKP